MGFTAREYRAIYAFAQKHDLVMSLCSRPWVYFNGGSERHRIRGILEEYDRIRKEDARAQKQNKHGQGRPGVV